MYDNAVKVVNSRSSTLSPLRIPEMPDKPVSRLAPTPSGFLHLGNAVNFLVAWALVRSHGGTLHLRIDDMDGIRFRQEVLEDIFISLDWLGLDWDTGPGGPDDFHRNFTLQAHKEHYRNQLKRLEETSGKVFTCVCSRSTIRKASTDGTYPQTCRNAGHAFIPGQSAIRLKVEDDSVVQVDGRRIDLAKEFGDFVLWRKDDQPSYQLASLLEDEKAGVNVIVRGNDLLLSTAAQLYTARLFGFSSFPAGRFLHHDLIMGSDGQKLSKSRGAYALKDIRESGLGPEVAVKAAAPILGLSPDKVSIARDLITGMLEKLPN